MQNIKTSVAGYIATAAGVLILVSDVLPSKWGALIMALGQVANGLGNIFSQDA